MHPRLIALLPDGAVVPTTPDVGSTPATAITSTPNTPRQQAVMESGPALRWSGAPPVAPAKTADPRLSLAAADALPQPGGVKPHRRLARPHLRPASGVVGVWLEPTVYTKA